MWFYAWVSCGKSGLRSCSATARGNAKLKINQKETRIDRTTW